MKRLAGLLLLGTLLIALPGWAASDLAAPPPDPDPGFRLEAEGAPAPAGTDRGGTGPTTGSPAPAPGEGAPRVRLADPTLLAASAPAPLLLAQAPGPAAPGAPAASSSPWVFGTTLYLWVPFTYATSTIGDPSFINHKPFNVDEHITNLFGMGGHFELSKGDWGGFADVFGFSLGLKSIPQRTDLSVETHDSGVDAEYGLWYRLLGQPLNLTTWATAKQPVSLDLFAGARTLYIDSSVSSQRVHAEASATLTSPLVGLRLGWDLTENWHLGLGGNIGGFGVSDTSLAWEGDLAVAYRFRIAHLPSDVSLGFRALGVNLETGAGNAYLKLNTIFYGPTIGWSVFF
jgi:hypothetical protein